MARNRPGEGSVSSVAPALAWATARSKNRDREGPKATMSVVWEGAGTTVRIGVPVATFPQWLRCPACGYLGSISTGLFELKTNPYRPDQAGTSTGASRGGVLQSRCPRDSFSIAPLATSTTSHGCTTRTAETRVPSRSSNSTSEG